MPGPMLSIQNTYKYKQDAILLILKGGISKINTCEII